MSIKKVGNFLFIPLSRDMRGQASSYSYPLHIQTIRPSMKKVTKEVSVNPTSNIVPW